MCSIFIFIFQKFLIFLCVSGLRTIAILRISDSVFSFVLEIRADLHNWVKMIDKKRFLVEM